MSLKIYDKKPEDFTAKVEVAACFLEISGKLLLLQRATGKETGAWGVPAGKLEKEETAEIAAKRELFEETRILLKDYSQIQKLGTLYICKPEIDYAFHCFKIDLKNQPEVILSDENSDYLWASSSDIEKLNLMQAADEVLQHYRQWKGQL
jgi:8-oxo-dGTP pyrophosphatase MutT (NUDIX family)